MSATRVRWRCATASGETAPTRVDPILVAVRLQAAPTPPTTTCRGTRSKGALAFLCSAARRTPANPLAIHAIFATPVILVTPVATPVVIPVVIPVVTLAILAVLRGVLHTINKAGRTNMADQTTTLPPQGRATTSRRRRRRLRHHSTLPTGRRHQAKIATLQHPYLPRTTHRVVLRHTSRLIGTGWVSATRRARKEGPRDRRLHNTNNRRLSNSKALRGSLFLHGLAPSTRRRRRHPLPIVVVPVETAALLLLLDTTQYHHLANGRQTRPHTTRPATCWRSRR